MHRIFAIGFLILALPALAHAEESTAWNFRNGTVPGQWNIRNITTTQPTSVGLHVATQQEGLLSRPTDIGHAIEVIRITLQTPVSTEFALVWNTQGEFRQMPFLASASESEQTIDLDLSTSRLWSKDIGEIGIAIPAGSEFILKEIELVRWNRFEKIIQGFKSAWVPDDLTPHSINFIWGPIITPNPIATLHMHKTDPPFGRTANWVIYAFLAVAAAVVFAWRRRLQSISPLSLFFLIFAGAWLLYDLRMGSELFSYVKSDWNEYILKESGERVFREYQHFYDVVEDSMPTLEHEPQYLFIGPSDSLVYAGLRYRTYPSIPVRPAVGEVFDQNVALIFRHNDAFVTQDGRFIIDSTEVSSDASLVTQFDDSSMLVRIHP